MVVDIKKRFGLLLATVLFTLAGCNSQFTITIEGQGVVEVVDGAGARTTCVGPATCKISKFTSKFTATATASEGQWFEEWGELCSGTDSVCVGDTETGDALVARFTNYYYGPYSSFYEYDSVTRTGWNLLESGIKVYDRQVIDFRGSFRDELRDVIVIPISPSAVITDLSINSVAPKEAEMTFTVGQVSEEETSEYLIVGLDNEDREYAMPISISVYPRSGCARRNIGDYLPCGPTSDDFYPNAVYKSGRYIYQEHSTKLFRYNMDDRRYYPGLPWNADIYHFNPSTTDYFYIQEGVLFQNNLNNHKVDPSTQVQISGDIISDDANILLVKNQVASCSYRVESYQLETYTLSGELIDTRLVNCLPMDSYTVGMNDIVPLDQGKGFIVYRTTGVDIGFDLSIHLVDSTGKFEPPVELNLPIDIRYRSPDWLWRNSKIDVMEHAVLSHDRRYLSYADVVIDLQEKTMLDDFSLSFLTSSALGFTDYNGGFKRSLDDSYLYPYKSQIQYSIGYRAMATFANTDGTVTVVVAKHRGIIDGTITQPLSPDFDGDGSVNSEDRFPSDAMAWKDDDRDGFPDEWAPGYEDGISDWGEQRYLDPLPDNPNCGTPEEVVDGQCLFDVTFTEESLQSGCEVSLVPQVYNKGRSLCHGYFFAFDLRGLVIAGGHGEPRVIRHLPLTGGAPVWNPATTSIALAISAKTVAIYNVLTGELRKVALEGDITQMKPAAEHYVLVVQNEDDPYLIDMEAGTSKRVIGSAWNSEFSFSQDMEYFSTWSKAYSWVDFSRYQKLDDGADYGYGAEEILRWDNGSYYRRIYIGEEHNKVAWFTRDDHTADHGGVEIYGNHCHVFDISTKEELFTECPYPYELSNGTLIARRASEFALSPNGRYLGWFAEPLSDIESDGVIWVKDLETEQVVLSIRAVVDGEKCYDIGFGVDSSNVICEGRNARHVIDIAH